MAHPLFDPVATSTDVESAYRRYLQSTHWVNDATLRKEFESTLATDFALTKGPLLQAMIPYETGASLEELVGDATLNQGFLQIPEETFPPGRPLYRHQELAIRKSLEQRNLIVATGTGSGKTECFLLPVINHLLNERDAGTLSQPGVRAMFLYPMNALANDQMKRIRELLAPFPEITFGRFIGDTQNTFKKALPLHRTRTGSEPLPNEMISREEMRENPPHILLTNYAMLEFLLLRPEETTLFDGPTGKHWRFIALDEVHVYDGAQGAEIAMLLRRVRDRVNQSQRGQIQYIGTSATLGKGEADYPNLASYAEALFDENVDSSDIVGATRQRLQHGAPEWELSTKDATALVEFISEPPEASDLRRYLASIGAPTSVESDDWRVILGSALEREHSMLLLQGDLEKGSESLRQLADTIFHGPNAIDIAKTFVFLGVQGISPRTGAPLVPARYHFLLRSLEGAFVCQSPRHPAGVARLSLTRHDQCPACSKVGNSSKYFELGACRKCGAGYLLGRIEESGGINYLQTASGLNSQLRYLLIDSKEEVSEKSEDEDEGAVTKDDDVVTELDQRQLCTACGSLTEGMIPGCDCGAEFARDVVVAHPKAGVAELRKCISCTGRSTAPIIMRFQTGQDAPVAVIATALYQALPESSNPEEQLKPGEGRKLLSFADSRQDAAFFAPYLERTYSRAVERRILWSVINKPSDDVVRFGDLVTPVRRAAEEALVLDPDSGGATNSERVRSWLMREVLAVDRRQSLDGVGLAEISIALPRGIVPPPPLLDLGFSEPECTDLLLVLLESLRLQAAVSVPDGVNIKNQIFSPRNVVTATRLEQSAYGILAWLPSAGTNRRLEFLNKVLGAKGIDTDARQLLSDLWTRVLDHPASPWSKVLDKQNKRGEGQVISLNPEWITFEPTSESHRPFTCPKCKQIWWRTVARVCPTFKCDGIVELLTSDIRSGSEHYRHLYQELSPIGLSVKEHTGQLESGYAAEIQQKFIDGDINALSCSTTFELGVDVGEVQAVLMKNVPPTPANYVQRAGRSGRRAGSAALVVTFAQRRNHDLHYFAHPSAMVDGTVSTPIISLENPQIVRRHLHAMALAEFEKRVVAAGGEWHKEVGQFFEIPDGSDSAPVDDFIAWLQSHPTDLGEAVRRVAPRGEDDRIAKILGVDTWAWVDALIAPSDHEESFGWLTRATDDARGDIGEVKAELAAANERWQELTKQNQNRLAMNQTRRMTVLQREQNTIQSRQLISYLAQRVVIPKYGFPVDVVTMEVLSDGDIASSHIDLSRDLRIGISEFAPGSQVIADGTYWEPVGLRRPPSKHLSERSWATCKECKAFQIWRGTDEFTCEICGDDKKSGGGKIVLPEFGFIGKRSKETPGEARPVRNGLSITHFSSYQSEAPPEQKPMLLGNRTIRYSFSRQGQITVINTGKNNQGFRVCLSCGRAEEVPTGKARRSLDDKPHVRPNIRETECEQHFRTMGLGHQYLTDVVELDFGVSMDWAHAQSLLSALLAACPEIGITRDDVTGTLRSQGSKKAPTLILIDAVPGGAGHATKIREHLEELVRSALRIVQNCDCGVDSSCYSCLRTYSNQNHHDELVRGDALQILTQFT